MNKEIVEAVMIAAGNGGYTQYQVEQIITAYEAALKESGFVIVPVEPTQRMIQNGYYGYSDSFGTPLTRINFAYKEMIKEAQNADQ